jgi:hypothetical protein
VPNFPNFHLSLISFLPSLSFLIKINLSLISFLILP